VNAALCDRNKIMLTIRCAINVFTGFVLTGCAMSMPPGQFMDEFPKATVSKFFTKLDANSAISSGTCKVLVVNRNYSAAIGFTVGQDLGNAANGVDGWVKSDGGNAYSLNNYRWLDLIDKTQLVVYFDTLSCKL
jgi:hypothetical protein